MKINAVTLWITTALLSAHSLSASATLPTQALQVIENSHAKVLKFDTQAIPMAQAQSMGIMPSAANAAWDRHQAQANASQVLHQAPVMAAIGLQNAQTQLAVQPKQSDAQRVRYQQLHQGIPVLGNAVIASYNAQHQLTQLVSHFDDQIQQTAQAKISADKAQAQAIAAANAQLPKDHDQNVVKVQGNASLYWLEAHFVNLDQDGYVLAYQVDVTQPDQDGFPLAYRYWIDANTGAVLANYSLQHTLGVRNTYDANHAGDPHAFADLAVLMKDAQGNVGDYQGTDPVVEAAHNYAGNTYDYYLQRFGRDSYDNNGAALNSYVHFATNYNNAFWYGPENMMVYGDGDGLIFTSLANSLNVVAHELTHAVTEHSAALEYLGPSGALNEAISDIMGKFTEAYANNGVIDNWLLGDEIVGSQYPREALRNMADPTFGDPFDPYAPFDARNQPDHMQLMTLTSNDNYAVHINSGIVNKLAYLLVEGGTFHEVTVPALGLNITESLVYQSLTNYLTATSDFYDFVDGLLLACQNGGVVTDASACTNAVSAAADAVGLNPSASNVRMGVGLVQELQGDGDALLEAGERVKIYVNVMNLGKTQTDALLTLQSSDPNISIDSTTATRTITEFKHFYAVYTMSAEATVLQDIPADQKVSMNLTVTSQDSAYHGVSQTQFEHFGSLRYGLPDKLVGAPVPFDMNQDGIQDISASLSVGWFMELENPTSLLSLNTGLLDNWPSTQFDTAFRTSAGIVGGEPVTAIQGRNQLVLMRADGTIKSAFSMSNSNLFERENVPVIADVNGDGQNEVIFVNAVSSGVYEVYVADANLNALSGWPRTLSRAQEIAVADMNGDGKAEVLVNAGKFMLLFDYKGNLMPGWPSPSVSIYYTFPVIADLDNDGQSEVIAATYDGLAAFHLDGSYVSGFPVLLGEEYDLAIRSLSVGDLDNDGHAEIVTGYGMYPFFTTGGKLGLFVFNDQGQVMPGWPNSSDFLHYPLLIDVDTDDDIEIVGETADGMIRAWNLDGSIVSGFPIVADFAWQKSTLNLTAGDFDGDQDLDLAYSGVGTLQVLDLDIPYKKEGMIWPMYMQNPQATSALVKTTGCDTPSLFIRGTFNQWANLAMTCVGNNVWELGELTLNSNAMVKFDVYGDWSLNYGDIAPADKIADQGGADISVASGTYKVRFNMTSKAYSFTSDQPIGLQRTVVFIYGQTQSGEDMFIRGGIDHNYAASVLGKQCTASNFECAIPIVHRNLLNATTAPWKANDNYLDWYGPEAGQSSRAQGSALDWTTNEWPGSWGPARFVDVDGYGLSPLSVYGMHYWMLDVDMDCSKTVNGWFELKSFIANGAGWEGTIAQSGTPYASGNHFAKCGMISVFKRNQNEPVVIQAFP